jgi:hypothetical protein
MKTFTAFFLTLSLLALFGVLVAGCGKKSGGDAKAFDSASTEIKAAWDKGLAAAKAKDYVAAISALQQLKTQTGLTPDQLKAVEEEATAISDEMYAAANKGDAKAKDAINKLRQLQRR